MIVFISNYLNHHQLPFCLAMAEKTGGNFMFIATMPVPEFRLQFGYADLNHAYDFVFRAYESKENRRKAVELCSTCDVLLYGSVRDWYILPRLRQKKLSFRYSERFFKTPFTLKNMFHRVGSMCKHMIPYQNKRHLLLCASAYTAADAARFGCYRGRRLQWGYFPEMKNYEDVGKLIEEKKKHSLLWVGRFLDWKHPEAALQVACRLQQDGYDFELTMIGAGEMEQELRQLVDSFGLSQGVSLIGTLPPQEVRRYMERAEIFLFTSDRREGWGAVLNEAMNSGCAVVASRAGGAAPFLIKDGENGLLYKDGRAEQLVAHVKGLLDDPARRQALGRAAYETMATLWNAEEATGRLLKLIERLEKGESAKGLFADGPCSNAPIRNR